MSETFSAISDLQLTQLSQPIRQLLHRTSYNPPESHDVSIKSLLESLLPPKMSDDRDLRSQIRDFSLCCALLSSSNTSTSIYVSWIPKALSTAADSAFRALSESIYRDAGWEEKNLAIELIPEVLPLLKDTIKQSSVDGSEEGDEISAASARAPLAYAIVAAYQLRWFVTQVEKPHLGNLCALVVPCALTALDHWSPEVKLTAVVGEWGRAFRLHRRARRRSWGFNGKPLPIHKDGTNVKRYLYREDVAEAFGVIPQKGEGQGMISFIHLAKNVNATELGCYGDVILDACCHNIVSSDEIWHHAVEMSVLLVTSLQRSNPRSPWFERMLNEMLGHLERQPRNKERRVAWLRLIEPLFDCIGLVLLAHFRPLFPLFFQWMHTDDDETVLLVLERILAIVKLTWIRHSPYMTRLVDELAILYKEAATRTAREEIRTCVSQILVLLQQCKGLQFEATWAKYKDDPNLEPLAQSVAGNVTTVV